VVGCDNNNIAATTFGWTEAQGMRYLHGLSVVTSCAYAVNDAGQVVGSSVNAAGQLHAFLWTHDGGARDLGSLGGATSVATAINNSGEAVGYSETASGVNHAFIWTEQTGMQDLMSLSTRKCPNCQSEAYAIDDAGLVAGEFGVNNGDIAWAIIWKNGNARNLGALGTDGIHYGSSARGINKSGQVVGQSYTSDGSRHAFLWVPSKGMQDLGTLPGFVTSFALGVNRSGQVVGYCESSEGGFRAFMWTNQDGMVDLGTLGGSSAVANAINDAGEVTGGADTQ
jgi:probable HAF family extracellular repeat protein